MSSKGGKNASSGQERSSQKSLVPPVLREVGKLAAGVASVSTNSGGSATVFLIRQRYVLGIMAFFAIVNGYTMRVSLHIAITEMVEITDVKKRPNSTTDCSVYGNFTPAVTEKKKLYTWTEHTQGIILSSFYWGYFMTQIPAGIISEKFGGKYTLGGGLFITGICTLFSPLIITSTGGNWIVLVIVRVLEGLGAGVTLPAINALLSNWVPKLERSRLSTLVFAGSQIGTIVTNTISGALISATKDWATVFYFFGGIAVTWCILWSLLCYSSPAVHPFISDKERDFLMEELGGVVTTQKHKKIPWKIILTSIRVWAMIAAQIGHDWGAFTMVTDLPKYMKDVLKFNVATNGLLTSLPYLVMWMVSMSTGVLCDWLLKKEYLTITMARKIFTTIGAMGPASFIMLASYSGCDKVVAVSFFTIGMASMGTYYSGVKLNPLDLAPHFAGTLMGLSNGIGAFCGVFTPYVVGALTPNRFLEEWRLVFWITFIVFSATTAFYWVFATGDQQWWSDIDQEGETTQQEEKEK